MSFVQGTCPNCNGILAVDKEKDAWLCPFCDTPFIVEKAVNIYNTTNNIKADTVNIIGSAEKNFEIIGGVLKSYRGEEIEVFIPNNVKEIGEKAFFNMPQITKVVIPDSVVKIGDSAFDNCSSLKDITFSKNLREICSSAFARCSALENITLNEGLYEIGSFVFSSCESLKNIVLPSSLKKIGRYVFYKCSSLESLVIPDNVECIENSVFSSCKSLKNIVLPSSLKKLGDHVFSECSSLESLVIPDNVERIESALCSKCSNLKYVKIGKNTLMTDVIDSPWGKPFFGCPKLLNIDYKHLDKYISSFPAYKEYQMYQQRMNSRLCYYCGGKFTGLFNKKCSVCGKPKSY